MHFSYEDTSKIVEMVKEEIEGNRNYRFLHKGILQTLWDERIDKSSYFCIYIKADIIDSIKIDIMKENMKNIHAQVCTSNFIEVDEEGTVIKQGYKNLTSELMKSELSNLSLKNLVFFFGESGITRYISGRAIEDNNIFYTRADRVKYYEKKDVSKLDEVIHEYIVSIVSQQVEYMYFFENNPMLETIDKSYIERNILKNKPEHFMRDHLQTYLARSMHYTFTVEPELGQSKRELDIYFDVSGELYFIEIKWLGVSVNNTGTGLTRKHADAQARAGVTQVLEYIEELVNTTEKSLRCGCLAIFDAREERKNIDFKEYKFVSAKLQPYMQKFKLLEIISLNKKHSA